MTALKTEKLTFRYHSLEALSQFTISVNSGEVVTLLGPNGAGKTTLFQLICGLMKPDTGTIHLFETDSARDSVNHRLKIGYCPQALSLWKDLTCLEQLVFMANLYGISFSEGKDLAHKLLDQLGLTSQKNKIADKLSGGMQRRLHIALSLIHDPPLLLLDEPTVGLDPQSRVQVRAMIRQLSCENGKTVIWATHDIEEADRVADRVAIMDLGKLLKLDTPEALKVSQKQHKPSLEDVFITLTGRSFR